MDDDLEHAGVKGMKWDNKKPEDELTPERITFNEIMLKQYKGPMTPDEQAKFVADRFALEQKVGSGKTKAGKTFFQMSNKDIEDFLVNSPTMKKKPTAVSKEKRAKAKKKVIDLVAKNSKKVVK